jgi:hypothetical protein
MTEGVSKLFNYSRHIFNEIEEVRNVNLINEQYRLIQKGVDESQPSFETLMRSYMPNKVPYSHN